MGKHLGEQRRRRDILAAAKSLFVRKGFADTSLDDIATEAGISRGGMYFYYRNKLEMLSALSAEEADLSLNFLTRALQEPAHQPHLLLDSILAYYIRFLVTRKDSTVLYQLLLDTAQRHEEIRHTLADNLKRVEDTLTLILDQSGVLKGLENRFTPRQMAMMINTVVEGVKSRYLVTGDAEAVKETVQVITAMAFPLSPLLNERTSDGHPTQETEGGASGRQRKNGSQGSPGGRKTKVQNHESR